jgi:hypothetical protein
MPTLAADYTNIPHMVVAERRPIAGTTGVIRRATTPLTYYAPSPFGRGGVRAKQSQKERLGFLVLQW